MVLAAGDGWKLPNWTEPSRYWSRDYGGGRQLKYSCKLQGRRPVSQRMELEEAE